MVRSKNELKRCLKEDQIALKNEAKKRPRLFADEIWKFEITMRKAEYYLNVYGSHSLLYRISKISFRHLSLKLGFTIPLNVFGPGLSISHYGMIVVNSNA